MKYIINSEEAIQDIANAIRAKTKRKKKMTVKEMPLEIAKISGEGSGGGAAQPHLMEDVVITQDRNGALYHTDADSYQEIIECLAADIPVKITPGEGSDWQFQDHSTNEIDAVVTPMYVVDNLVATSGYARIEGTGIFCVSFPVSLIENGGNANSNPGYSFILFGPAS